MTGDTHEKFIVKEKAVAQIVWSAEERLLVKAANFHKTIKHFCFRLSGLYFRREVVCCPIFGADMK